MTAVRPVTAVVRGRGAHHRARVSSEHGPGHRFVTSDGTALRYRLSGPEDAPVTLVLVHGWTQDHRTWDRVAGAIEGRAGGAERVRILRYDLRGHGGSAAAPPGTATIARLADDLAELIEGLVPAGPLVLAGHSMGGMTIMELADRHPALVAERIAGIAFVATSCGQMNKITLGLPGIAGSGAARFERRLAKMLSRQRRDAFPLRRGVIRPCARWLVFGERPRRDDVDSVAEQLLCAHPASVGGFQDAISRHDRRGALGALRGIPAVVLAGDRDRLCPVRHAEVIAEELPDARFVRYPGAGHMLPQERGAEVAERISALIRQVTSR